MDTSIVLRGQKATLDGMSRESFVRIRRTGAKSGIVLEAALGAGFPLVVGHHHDLVFPGSSLERKGSIDLVFGLHVIAAGKNGDRSGSNGDLKLAKVGLMRTNWDTGVRAAGIRVSVPASHKDSSGSRVGGILDEDGEVVRQLADEDLHGFLLSQLFKDLGRLIGGIGNHDRRVVDGHERGVVG